MDTFDPQNFTRQNAKKSVNLVLIAIASSLEFSQFSGAGQIIAGTGINKSGNTLTIDNTVTTLETTATSYNYAGVSGHHSLLYASRNLAIVADGANQGAIKFMAGNGERMRILHDGGVCINATS